MRTLVFLFILFASHAHAMDIPIPKLRKWGVNPAPVEVLIKSRCIGDYEERTWQLTRKSVLRPFIHTAEGAAGTAALAWVGSSVGGLSKSKTTGAIIGSSWGITIGVYGTLITLVGREAFIIRQLVDHYRAQRLIEEAYTDSGKITEKFIAKLKKRNVVLDRPVDELIRELDQSGTLCERKPLGFRRLLRLISGGKYKEDSIEQPFQEHSTTQSSSHSSEETPLQASQNME